MRFFHGQDRSFLTDAAKPPGLFRIICVGDSMTYGQGVKPTESLAFQLENTLNAAIGNVQIEVVNGGVCGYSAFDSWTRYIDKFTPYDADLVVLIVCDNDAELYSQAEAKDDAVRSLTYLQFSEMCYDPAGVHFPYLRVLLADIGAYVSRARVPVVIAFYHAHGGDHRDRIVPRILEACREADVPFIDLSQDFVGESSATHHSYLQVSDIDYHPSAIAHRIAARRLARYLTTSGLTPSPDGDLMPEKELIASCISVSETMTREGTHPWKSLFLLSRTLQSKLGSRRRRLMRAEGVLDDTQRVTGHDGLVKCWRQMIEEGVVHAYTDDLRAAMCQVDFALGLFDIAKWRVTKNLMVLEARMRDPSLPEVGQFLNRPDVSFTELALNCQTPKEPDDETLSRFRCRLDTLRDAFAQVEGYVRRSSTFHADSLFHGIGKAIERRRSSTVARFDETVSTIKSEVDSLLLSAYRYVERFHVVLTAADRTQPHVNDALMHCWMLIAEMLCRVELCFVPLRLDVLGRHATLVDTLVMPGLTNVQVTLRSLPISCGQGPGEPTMLEVQLRPSNQFSRPTADIHLVVSDGISRTYEFLFPFFVQGDILMAVNNIHRTVVEQVRVFNHPHMVLTLDADAFAIEQPDDVLIARVVVPS
jgi:lysophospholipase L1-like esterase